MAHFQTVILPTLKIRFQINKDAGRYVCKAGHTAVRKTRQGKKGIGQNQGVTYFFDVELCKRCPLREGCYKEGAKSKNLLGNHKIRRACRANGIPRKPVFQGKGKRALQNRIEEQ